MGGNLVRNLPVPLHQKDAINKAWFERYMLIPRCRSLEEADRKGSIVVRINPKEPNYNALVGSSEIFAFTTQTSRKTIEFCFPTFVNLSGITLNPARNSEAISKDWSLNYYNETNSDYNWINMTIKNYATWIPEGI